MLRFPENGTGTTVIGLCAAANVEDEPQRVPFAVS
jgi:hypothetical protein